MHDSDQSKGQRYLPTTVRNRVIWLIRDSERLQQEADDLLTVASGLSPQIRSKGGHGDPVFRAVKKREKNLKRLKAIQDALQDIPEEYREGVFRSIRDRDPYPQDADRSTYSRHKQKLIYDIAVRLSYI